MATTNEEINGRLIKMEKVSIIVGILTLATLLLALYDHKIIVGKK